MKVIYGVLRDTDCVVNVPDPSLTLLHRLSLWGQNGAVQPLEKVATRIPPRLTTLPSADTLIRGRLHLIQRLWVASPRPSDHPTPRTTQSTAHPRTAAS